jgi:hypothetical protein
MASEIDICNNALLQLGENVIISFDDDSNRARLCKRFYQDMRDSVLRAYPWKCAVAFQGLSLLAGSDMITGSGFSYTYQLPVSPYCLRALLLNNDKTVEWQVVGRKLVTDESSVTLKFIARIVDPGLFDALLSEAIACRLSQIIAYPITANTALAKAMWEIYQAKLSEARSIDGMEGFYEELTSDDLLTVR